MKSMYFQADFAYISTSTVLKKERNYLIYITFMFFTENFNNSCIIF